MPGINFNVFEAKQTDTNYLLCFMHQKQTTVSQGCKQRFTSPSTTPPVNSVCIVFNYNMFIKITCTPDPKPSKADDFSLQFYNTFSKSNFRELLLMGDGEQATAAFHYFLLVSNRG